MTVLDRPDATVEACAQRVLDAALGAVDLLSIHLGDRLGWYRSLAEDGPATAAELAERTGTAPRYAQEWLEQQAVTGVLTASPATDPAQRVFALAAAFAEVLTDERSLSYLAPLARQLAAAAVQVPALVEAYRSGGGVPWARYGREMRESQGDLNRPWYERELAGALASAGSALDGLRRPGARIADIGCGAGWSSIALARALPGATVDAVDIDEPSVALARAHVAAAGLGSRVRTLCADAAGLPVATYDAVFAFECLHDLPRPVEVLAAAAAALTPGGSVLVMDEAVAERFSPPGDEIERLMYGFSLLICLPDGLSHPPSVGTGTVLRPDTLRRYASDAGLATFEVLPVEGFGFWRFYRLAR